MGSAPVPTAASGSSEPPESHHWFDPVLARRLFLFQFPFWIVCFQVDRMQPFFAQSGQLLVVLATLCYYGVLLWNSRPRMRRQLVLIVFLCLYGEVPFSLIFGMYTYRFDNLPLFVPTGHALVFWNGLYIASLVAVRSERVTESLMRGAGLISLAGLFAFGDRSGFLMTLLFLWSTRGSRGHERTIYAVMFWNTLLLELLGTHFGVWGWKPIFPGTTALTSWNPPIGAGFLYVLLDRIVLAVDHRIEETREDRVRPLPAGSFEGCSAAYAGGTPAPPGSECLVESPRPAEIHLKAMS